MSLTSLIFSLMDFTFLILGLTVLNWVFQPKWYRSYDFILMMVTVGIFYIHVVWAVALNYGVERL